ncbi:transposase [Brevibacillus panacihumi]|uniref:transposase n=1 Tax=Brevibacillus panacihumi TaxID=497735 RepID=UPI003D1BB0C4
MSSRQIRNSIKYVSYKDLKKITSELKPIYKAPTEQAALEELEQFEQTWGSKYPLMVVPGGITGTSLPLSLDILQRFENLPIQRT